MLESLKLTDFMKYRFLSGVKFAPDGAHAALVVANANEEENTYEARLWLWDGNTLRKLTDLGKEKSYFWEDARHLLFAASRSAADKKREENKEVFTSFYRLAIDGGEAEYAFTLPFAVKAMKPVSGSLWAATGVIDVKYPDYYRMTKEEQEKVRKEYADEEDYQVLDEIPYWSNGDTFTNRQRTALFLVDIQTMDIRRVTAPDFDVDSFAVLDEKVYFFGASFGTKYPLYTTLWTVEDGAAKQLTGAGEISFNHLLPVGGELWALATEGKRHGINENAWVYRVNTETGELTVLRREECNLYNSTGSDCRLGGGESSQAKGGEMYFNGTREGNAFLMKMNADGEVSTIVSRPGSVDSFAVCEDADYALVVGMYGGLQELYRCDLATGDLVKLSSFNDEILSGKYVADYQPLTVKSCGLDIGGWVLLPKDYDPAKTYPAVLDIHGGPKTVYGPIFYHEMQLWANMGYFVFFCNPKGGDGRDNEFMDIRGEYGHTDYQNLMDFTDAVLKAYPQIDAKRVCVTGGSYGGFMTNWIIGHTDRFVCAASQRSIANWLSFYGLSDIGYYFAADQCDGNPYDDAEKLWDLSPLRYAKNVVTPTLFIHSDQDYRCPMPEGLQMYAALVDRGVPARLCLFHGENHELSRSGKPKHRQRRLEEITNWFEKYAK